VKKGEVFGYIDYIQEVGTEEVGDDMIDNHNLRQSMAPSEANDRISVESQGKQAKKKAFSAITSPVQDGKQ